MTLDPSSPNTDAAAGQGSRLISRLLPPAIRLWLHTQLDHIEGLDLAINGKDRQILGGYLPGVTVAAHQAVYQGLHVSQVQVNAADIRVNLPQVLRGKPLRLLQPFPVQGQVTLLAEDLRASLRSPLLGQALHDALTQLLSRVDPPLDLGPWLGQGDGAAEVAIALDCDRLTLSWTGQPPQADHLTLTVQLAMGEGRWLCLQTLVATIQPAQGDAARVIALDDITFDLGPEVNIQQLAVTPTGIDLIGAVRVIPAD
jgi:hypothetical protein